MNRVLTMEDLKMLKNLNGSMEIAEQGIFMAGGRMIQKNDKFDHDCIATSGQTIRGDHAYVFYQIPVKHKKYPLIFLHGHNQSGMSTWGMTPDRRDGFQNIFLKQDFSVYLLDQPRRGEAGRSTESYSIIPEPDEQRMFNTYRLGVWPDYYENTQYDRREEILDQFFRRNTPNTAAFDLEIVSAGVAAAINKVGSSVLITHSQGGGVGWSSVMKTDCVKGIISYEPGSNFVFPMGEAPNPITGYNGIDVLCPQEVPKEDFLKLTKMPVVIYYGDNIPKDPCADPGMDHWRMRVIMANHFAKAVNSYGGDAQVVCLPDKGIFGNGHFPFQEKNNIEVANVMMQFLEEKNLAGEAILMRR